MNADRRVALITCRAWPDLSTSDQALSDRLVAHGHEVRTFPWNETDPAEVAWADLAVFRSNWDYHHELDAFTAWLDALEQLDVEVHNPLPLIRWGLDKRNAVGIDGIGIRTPQTLVCSDELVDGGLGPVHDWIDTHEFDRVVVKPAWGASGHNVQMVAAADLESVLHRWRARPERRPLLIQEFMPGIADGEYALVFFRGEFSHALIRRPANDDFRVNSRYGGTMAAATDLDTELLEFGIKVEASLEPRPTYVRIDVVRDGPGLAVMEVEVNEPALGLNLVHGAAERFAEALLMAD
ncbi:MAG: hypothetical protein AAGD35_03505 [Actinomycetota bacterium]